MISLGHPGWFGSAKAPANRVLVVVVVAAKAAVVVDEVNAIAAAREDAMAAL